MVLQINDASQEFEKESRLLEAQSEELFCDTVANKDVIVQSIAEASNNKREELSSVLQNIEILSNVEE